MASKSKIAKANRKPKFSSRRENRCKICGRPRAVYRKFGICRICFRELGRQGPDSGRPEGELVVSDWLTVSQSAERILIAAACETLVHPGVHDAMMTDPIADMLTRIRNAVRIERPTVTMPLSKVKRGLAEVLKREGYIWDWHEEESERPARTSSCTST